jgi:hypothetical protein
MNLLLGVLVLLAASAVDDAASAQWAAYYDGLATVRKQAEAAAKGKQPEAAVAYYTQLGALAGVYLGQVEAAQKQGVWKASLRIKTPDGTLSAAQFIAALKSMKSTAATQLATAQAASQKAQAGRTEQVKAQLAAQKPAAPPPPVAAPPPAPPAAPPPAPPKADPGSAQDVSKTEFGKKLIRIWDALDQIHKESHPETRAYLEFLVRERKLLEQLRDHLEAEKRTGRWNDKAYVRQPSGRVNDLKYAESYARNTLKANAESYARVRARPDCFGCKTAFP